MKTAKKLKPCPFCGGKPSIGSLCGDKQNWAIWCEDCKIAIAETGLQGNTKKEIINSWNTRTKKQKTEK